MAAQPGLVAQQSAEEGRYLRSVFRTLPSARAQLESPPLAEFLADLLPGSPPSLDDLEFLVAKPGDAAPASNEPPFLVEVRSATRPDGGASTGDLKRQRNRVDAITAVLQASGWRTGRHPS